MTRMVRKKKMKKVVGVYTSPIVVRVCKIEFVILTFYSIFIQRPKSVHCLALSLSQCSLWNLNCWISQSCYGTWIFLGCYMDLSKMSKMIHGFLKVITWFCQNWFMDFSKLLYGFSKVVLCVSRPLPNKTKLKFDQDSKLVKASALN